MAVLRPDLDSPTAIGALLAAAAAVVEGGQTGGRCRPVDGGAAATVLAVTIPRHLIHVHGSGRLV